ncbi:hypothetical protein BH11CYA1_BH11CYA1_23930 [soil metagenome]
MVGRTKRKRYKHPRQLALATFLILSTLPHLPCQAQPAVSNSAKNLKQRLLVRELILLQGHANRANQGLISNVEALANRLPVLLSYAESQGTQNLNQNQELLHKLEKVTGPNPFEQEPQLKAELDRTRQSLESEGVGKVNDGLRQKEATGTRSRIFFRRPTIINPTEPVRTVDTLMAEDDGRWPGTINILIDATGSYVIFATGLDGRHLKQGDQTVCKSGHLN